MSDQSRTRMTRSQRRLQLIEIARASFAVRGYDGTSIEEIAAAAKVSKPVIYEHFGGKEGLYQVVVDREINSLLSTLASSMPEGTAPRRAVTAVITGVLDYAQAHPDGYRLLVHQSPAGVTSGVFAPVIGEVSEHLTTFLARDFERAGLDPTFAPIYGNLLGGAVAHAGLWWSSDGASEGAAARSDFTKEEMASHMINLIWNGLHALEKNPQLDALVSGAGPADETPSPDPGT